MLIRPQQALQLARNNSKLLIFNNILKIYGIQASLSDLYQEKEDNPYSFVLFHTFSRPSYLTRCKGSKLALLHRVKERKTSSLSTQASFAPFSLKVAWSGKSLINDQSLISFVPQTVPRRPSAQSNRPLAFTKCRARAERACPEFHYIYMYIGTHIRRCDSNHLDRPWARRAGR